ncbi:MAG: metallophosphoesterase [Acidobacteriota bacterium]|nr:metallophosphoesterase [Acidobacteriota bacterium]
MTKPLFARLVATPKPILSVFGVGLLLSICTAGQAQSQPSTGTWKFAVSGDSRNCGDIVMPAIAQGVLHDGAAFYWHLGDYRAIQFFDEDYKSTHPQATIANYFADAWPDFIQHQLKPFGNLPIFLAPGNHEMVPPMDRPKYIAQFADWLDQPVLEAQRLADNPADHQLKPYNHWIERGVDFISMDNASPDMFDAPQMKWFTGVLARAAKDPAVRSIVVGMHATLPEGLSTGHSMNDSAQQQATGRQVYAQLVDFRRSTGKNVYVLASHSHFVLNNVYDTKCNTKDTVLPGWIIGSAGAVRYRLPLDHAVATVAFTDVYGYLIGTVAPDGAITFEFKQVNESDVPASVTNEFPQKQVDWCFAENKSNFVPAGPVCPCTSCAQRSGE